MLDGELDQILRDALSLRDRILAANMETHRGHARELVMASTKLDECHQWLFSYGLRVGSHLAVSKHQYKEGLDLTAGETVETGETVPEEAVSV